MPISVLKVKSKELKITRRNKKSPANANGNAQQLCMFESPVKQNQSPEGDRRPAANYL